MKTFAHYLKSSRRALGFYMGSHVRVSPCGYLCGAPNLSRFFLALQWRAEIFTFAVLPFGLSSACFYFTKLLRPLVKRWRSMSHSSFVYLDGGFGSQPDQCSPAAAAVIQKRELNSSGFLVNEDNPIGIPCKLANGWVS